MENKFKQQALEVLFNNVKSKSDMNEYELGLIKYAFEIGFDIGNCNNEPDFTKQIALLQLSL